MLDVTEDFVSRWLTLGQGAERANYVMFLCELCAALDLPPPEPASAHHEANDYVFERLVRPHESEADLGPMRIDLYRRDAFVLEAKQSRWPSRSKATSHSATLTPNEEGAGDRLGHRGAGARWDALMAAARRQAERYVNHLPPDHRAPPFVIVCDVAHAFEIYADFSGTGRAYSHFPDRQGFRIYLEDLRDPDRRDRLRRIWTEPWSLDPAQRKARASREIARRLGAVAASLEREGKPAAAVAQFLMRCIFTLYACSMDLLPRNGFARLLAESRERQIFAPMVGELWRKMNDPAHAARFVSALGEHVRFFGGRLFREAEVFELRGEALDCLIEAAACDWSQVEPAIFGAFLERALGGDERRAGGVHYTPRPYVERLVEATVTGPLRRRWTDAVRPEIDHALTSERPREALALARAFHAELCALTVLDPACGTGNFLYVALDLLKRLEGEVLEAMAQLGANETMDFEAVGPRNFTGIEINPRAAVIAETVMLLGYLQLHYRNHSGHPSEPILRDFGCVTQADAILEHAPPLYRPGRTGEATVEEAHPHPCRPDWPQADYIVGNPPFLGGKDLRRRLGDAYAEALWAAHPQMNPSADLVMYWWDHAGDLLTREGTRLRRFGFVTTNSITQAHQRRTVERWLKAARPLHLTLAIPDHPWTRASPDAAAVRVAMTVAQAGSGEGERLELLSESGLDGDAPQLVFRAARGLINADLSLGVDLTRVEPLLANRGLCSPGVKLHGAGFIVTAAQAETLGLGRRPGLETYIRPYVNGRDLMQRSRGALVIDLYPLAADAVRARFPEVFQHLLVTVKPHRDTNRMAFRREHWWWFGATHEMYRGLTAGLSRYIVTPETAKHRVVTFLDAGVRADNMVLAIGSDDAFHLGVLSSRPHLAWALAVGAVLEDRPRYTKTACFDPFPFPDPPPPLRREIAATAQALDAARRAILADHPELTLTALYNALEAFRRGSDGEAVHTARAPILDDLHRQLDAQVSRAYGWPGGLSDTDMVAQLAELNRGRRAQEQAGEVAWLRPAYQPRRFGPRRALRQGELALHAIAAGAPATSPGRKRAFPRARSEQPLAVMTMLRETGAPLSQAAIAERFRAAGQASEAISAALRTLTLYGYIDELPDGRYLARRAA
jgi:hypothetical protein